MEEISIVNKTMELGDCKEAWFFNEKYQVWCLEDILYTPCPTTPKFQRMSIFVPKAYMSAPGVIDPKGEMNGYRADTVPVIFENNSAGYMQMPHIWLGGPRCFAEPYLAHGYVYVTCGNRGSESKDPEGKFCGRAPINLVDLKMAIRFLRHNRQALPGNFDRLISAGWSAGGAMSTLLAVTGNNKNFDPYLKASGAFMEESDAVYASQIYCPVTDLEHADMAYEWTFRADPENEDSPAGPAGVMTPFSQALSKELFSRYIRYFNSLGLKEADGSPLFLGEDGRSGTAYDALLEELSLAASKYLKRCQEGRLPEKYSVEDYLNGHYTFPAPAPMGPGPKKGEKTEKGEKSENGNSAQMAEAALDEPLALGNLVSRPPKGVEFRPFMPPMIQVPGRDKHQWLSWDGEKAAISDLDAYVLNQRRRMKPCTSFDVLAMNSGENRVYGNSKIRAKHFSVDVAEAIAGLRQEFPEEYEKYDPAYEGVYEDADQQRQKYLYNPYSFIHTEEASTQAQYYRIRVGANDADTSFMVSLTLSKALENAGKSVDYAIVWEQPHWEADYPGEVLDWIDSICRS